jgi:hypothetical protein
LDDADYFVAAAALARPDRWDLVIGEEWQTATTNERLFAQAIVGLGRFIEVRDSSRALHRDSPAAHDCDDRIELTRRHRGSEALRRLDMAYVHPDLDQLPPPGSLGAVSITEVGCGQDEPQKAVLARLEALRRRGIAPREVGVVTTLGRAQSGVLKALNGGAPPHHAMRLSEPWAPNHTACDSFVFWMGLERRVMVVVEAPHGLPERRRRIHIALSRACEEVHFLLPKVDLDSDEVLSEWLRASGESG